MKVSAVTHYTQDEFWARKGLTLIVPEEKPTSSFLFFHDNLVLQTYLEQPKVILAYRENDVHTPGVTLTDVRNHRKTLQEQSPQTYWSKDLASYFLSLELSNLLQLDEHRLKIEIPEIIRTSRLNTEDILEAAE